MKSKAFWEAINGLLQPAKNLAGKTFAPEEADQKSKADTYVEKVNALVTLINQERDNERDFGPAGLQNLVKHLNETRIALNALKGIASKEMYEAATEQLGAIENTVALLDVTKNKTLETALDSTAVPTVAIGEDAVFVRNVAEMHRPIMITNADNKEVQGYFTNDRKLLSEEAYKNVKTVFDKGLEKYPNNPYVADFIKKVNEKEYGLLKLISCMDREFSRDGELTEQDYENITLHNIYRELDLDKYGFIDGENESIDAGIYQNRGLRKFLSDLVLAAPREREYDALMSDFNIYGASEENGLKVQPGSSLAGRNVAASNVANLLGVPNLITRANRVTSIENGQAVDGVFIEKPVGKLYQSEAGLEHTDFIHMDEKSFDGEGVLKQIADLQVLDYLCHNSNRRVYNIRYTFGDDGKVTAIQGTNNSWTFGTNNNADTDNLFTGVALNDITVISEAMAERIRNLQLETLEAALQGSGLLADEITAAKNRLGKLKDYIEKRPNDTKEPAAGKVIIVKDDEWKNYTFKQLAEARTYFNNQDERRHPDYDDSNNIYSRIQTAVIVPVLNAQDMLRTEREIINKRAAEKGWDEEQLAEELKLLDEPKPVEEDNFVKVSTVSELSQDALEARRLRVLELAKVLRATEGLNSQSDASYTALQAAISRVLNFKIETLMDAPAQAPAEAQALASNAEANAQAAKENARRDYEESLRALAKASADFIAQNSANHEEDLEGQIETAQALQTYAQGYSEMFRDSVQQMEEAELDAIQAELQEEQRKFDTIVDALANKMTELNPNLDYLNVKNEILEGPVLRKMLDEAESYDAIFSQVGEHLDELYNNYMARQNSFEKVADVITNKMIERYPEEDPAALKEEIKFGPVLRRMLNEEDAAYTLFSEWAENEPDALLENYIAVSRLWGAWKEKKADLEQAQPQPQPAPQRDPKFAPAKPFPHPIAFLNNDIDAIIADIKQHLDKPIKENERRAKLGITDPNQLVRGIDGILNVFNNLVALKKMGLELYGQNGEKTPSEEDRLKFADLCATDLGAIEDLKEYLTNGVMNDPDVQATVRYIGSGYVEKFTQELRPIIKAKRTAVDWKLTPAEKAEADAFIKDAKNAVLEKAQERVQSYAEIATKAEKTNWIEFPGDALADGGFVVDKIPLEIQLTGDVNDLAAYYVKNKEKLEWFPDTKDYLQRRIGLIQYYNDLAKETREKEAEPVLEVDTSLPEGSFGLKGYEGKYQYQTTSNGCWSCAYAMLLESRGVSLNQQFIRMFRSDMNADEVKPKTTSLKNYSGLVSDSYWSIFEMGDLTLKMFPTTTLRQVELSLAGDSKDYDALKAQFISMLKEAMLVHKSPVAINNRAHFTTIVGVEGDKLKVLNSRSGRPDLISELSIDDVIRNNKEVSLTWMQELKFTKNGQCTNLPDRFNYVNYYDGQLARRGSNSDQLNVAGDTFSAYGNNGNVVIRESIYLPDSVPEKFYNPQAEKKAEAEPVAQQPQQNVQQPQPVVQQPVVQQPQPEVQQLQQAVQQPQPGVQQPQPGVQQGAEQPQQGVQQPQPGVQQPHSEEKKTETEPVAQQGAEQQPKPEGQQPQQGAQQPKQEEEQPKTEVKTEEQRITENEEIYKKAVAGSRARLFAAERALKGTHSAEAMLDKNRLAIYIHRRGIVNDLYRVMTDDVAMGEKVMRLAKRISSKNEIEAIKNSQAFKNLITDFTKKFDTSNLSETCELIFDAYKAEEERLAKAPEQKNAEKDNLQKTGEQPEKNVEKTDTQKTNAEKTDAQKTNAEKTEKDNAEKTNEQPDVEESFTRTRIRSLISASHDRIRNIVKLYDGKFVGTTTTITDQKSGKKYEWEDVTDSNTAMKKAVATLLAERTLLDAYDHAPDPEKDQRYAKLSTNPAIVNDIYKTKSFEAFFASITKKEYFALATCAPEQCEKVEDNLYHRFVESLIPKKAQKSEEQKIAKKQEKTEEQKKVDQQGNVEVHKGKSI